jgi:hypothetical protein
VIHKGLRRFIDDDDSSGLPATHRWAQRTELVHPVDVDGLITADTRPWLSIEEFDNHRDALENWKKSQRHVLKKVADLHDLNERPTTI